MAIRFTVTVLVFAAGLLPEAALAQQGRGGGRGGFRGGRGGGFDITGLLLQNDKVVKELQLSSDQAEKVKAAVKQVRDKHQVAMDPNRGQNSDPNVSMREFFARIEERNRAIATETSEALATILSPEQLKRFKEISLQQRGVEAFRDVEVLKRLKLTPEQKDELKAIADLSAGDLRLLSQNSQDPDYQKKLAAQRKRILDEALSVLTDEQRQAWKDMSGKPFEVVLAFPRGGGFGGFGPRGP
jgi:hypothetical protein